MSASPRSAPARLRAPGLVGLGVCAAAAAGLVAHLATAYDPELFDRYAPLYLSGLWTTILLVVTSFLVGALISVPVAAGRRARSLPARWLSFAFVYFFRGTPLIAQIFLIYYGLGQFRPQLEAVGLWWFFRDAWYCAIFAVSLNSAAYQAEILRGAVESLPRGQWEGARALGLPRWLILRKIVLPQALIVALRPYANEIILIIKASAIVAIITVYDLMGETRRAYSRTFDFQTYLWAAVLYLLIVEALRNATNLAERRLLRHLKP